MSLRSRWLAAAAIVAMIAGVIAITHDDPSVKPMTSKYYGDIPLSESGRAALRTVVDGFAELVVRELANVTGGPFAAIALDQGQLSLDEPPVIALATQADLDALLAEEQHVLDYYVWVAWEYSQDIDEPAYPSAEIVRAWRLLLAELDGKVIDPVLWTLVRVAFKLNRMPLPVPTTDDATVFVFNREFDQGGAIAFSTPEDVLQRLRRRGYLPPRLDPVGPTKGAE